MIKMQYPLNYTGDNLDYRVFNEERTITQEVDKVIVLDFGAFFTKSLVIRNNVTKLPLRAGTDYEVRQLDYVATKESGQEVATRILIKSNAVKSISYDYMFVGGEHMNGLHLLKALREKYPQGLVNTYEWDKVLNKPETFRPKFHQMHVKDLYGFDGAATSLDRMIAGVKRGVSSNTSELMKRVVAHLDGTQQALTETLKELDETLTQAFEDLSVQDGEYIFTDSAVDPSVLRGYGTWVRVTNTILRGKAGEASFAVDAGNVLAIGSQQILRNCYVWRNTETKMRPTYILSSNSHAGYSSSQRVEDRDIVFNLTTTGIVAGGAVAWVLLDSNGKTVARELLEGEPTGRFIVDSSGKATVTVKFKPNTDSAKANKIYTFRLLHTVDVKFSFTLIDVSAEKRLSLWFSSDVAGTRPVSSANEGQAFYLNITTVGYTAGESIYLDWGNSSLTSAEMVSALPNILSNTTTNKQSIKLQAKENMLTDGLRALIVYAVQSLGEPLSSHMPHAEFTIRDSSQNTVANISFNANGVLNVYEVDEGKPFTILINSNIPNEKVELLFESTRPLSDFTGLTSLITTDAVGSKYINVTNNEDFLTAKGTQRLTVIAYYKDVEIGRNQIYFKDTSQSPKYEVSFSKTAGGASITQIAEGEKFYFNVKVPNWVKPSNPPVLDFLYMFNDNPSTTKAEINTRVISSLYDNMAFDSSAAVFTGVSWVNNNTLSLEFTLNANRSVDGDDVFKIAVKQHNQEKYTLAASITLLDTSIYTITGTWSSSPTQLLPITQTNEMLTNGLNNTAYLWIDVDGDASLMGEITLETTASLSTDIVTTFPQTFTFAKGETRKVVSVTMLADFTTDLDKTIAVSGKYKVENSGRYQQIFNSSIMIKDNSVLSSMTMQLSSDPVAVIHPEDGFSEWYPLYFQLGFPGYAFESVITWRISYVTNSNQFEVESGEVIVPANATSTVITLNPKRDRIADGTAKFNIHPTRYIRSSMRRITPNYLYANQILKDDSLPPAVTLKLYSDAERTKEITSIDEGKTVYLRAIVNNPDRDSMLYFHLDNAVDANVVIGGVTHTAYGDSSVGTKLDFSNNMRSHSKYGYSNDFKEYYADTTLLVIADRTTNTGQAKALALTASLTYITTNTTVGVLTNRDFINSILQTKDSKAIKINDSSKTATYSVTNPTTANEGTTFEIKLNVTNGTVGDVFYPSITSNFLTSRLDINELGLEQVLVLSGDVLTWKFRAKDNRFTDTTTGTFTVQFKNKTTGTNVASATVTINDTSKTPDYHFYAYDITAVSNAVRTTVNEGNSNIAIYIANKSDLLIDEEIKIEWVSGRAADQFPAGTFTTHSLSMMTGNVIGLKLPFYPKLDRKTNSIAESTVTIKATTTISNVSKTLTLSINDVSKDLAFLKSRWTLVGGTTAITSVNEDQPVELQVRTSGGPESIDIVCANNGGRSTALMTTHSYGVTKQRTSDAGWVKFPFTPKGDAATNSGVDTKLSVRLTLGGSVTLDATIPVNDTSNNANYTLKVYKQGDVTQTPVTFMLENTAYQLMAYGTGAPLASTVKLVANTNTHYHSTPINDKLTNHGGSPNFAVISVSLASAGRTPTASLWYEASIITGGVTKATLRLPVVDNGIQQVTGRLTSTVDINTAITGAAIGNTISFVMDPNCFVGVDWNLGTNHVVRWKFVNANTEAIINNPNESNSNIAFNASALTTFNGGKGYKVNIPLNSALAVNDVKVVMYEEYTLGGVLQSVRLGETNRVTLVSASTAPAITDIYYSSNAQGTDRFTTIYEGLNAYLIVKTRNVPINTAIKVNWDGSTTNSDDFLTASTDGDVNVKVTTYNSAGATGMGYYLLDTLFDEKPDIG